MNLDDLRKPFDPAAISWRVGSTTKDKTKGMALAYIDARDVQDRLDAVCGVGGWQCRYVPMHDKKTVCEVGVWVEHPGFAGPNRPAEWIWKADGAGDSDVEAEKGALSDAFKRAAVRWGVGRYLYDLDSPWVELETYEKGGQTYVKGIKASEFTKLRAILAGNKPPAAANTSPPPLAKPAQDADIEDGVRNWTAQRRAEIDEAARIPDLYQWQDQHESALQRLKSKHKAAYDGLMQYYQAKFDILSKKEAAE
jgi:hypothetical protein